MLKHLKSFARKYHHKFNKENNRNTLKMCKKCHTFYYKSSWHFEEPKELEGEYEPVVAVRFTQCSACLEEELVAYDLSDALPA